MRQHAYSAVEKGRFPTGYVVLGAFDMCTAQQQPRRRTTGMRSPLTACVRR